MGEVYRGRDTRLHRAVAIKILPSHLSSNPARRQRFEREAKTISNLNHAHICTLDDIGHQDGIDFLVMEYLEGETLATRLEKGPLTTPEILRYGVEIADALSKAHRQGITHRDLKPGNIMLTKSGAKLLDFGLAKVATGLVPAQEGHPQEVPLEDMVTLSKPLTAEGTLLGTFQYMAPEQLEGNEADARTDIFAFGAVLTIIAAILSADPPSISSLQPLTPPALDPVAKTCLAKDPDVRFQTAHDLKLQLQWIAEAA